MKKQMCVGKTGRIEGTKLSLVEQVKQVTAGVDELVERAKKVLPSTAINHDGGSNRKEREFLTPKRPDGSGGEVVVVGNVQTNEPVQLYAEVQPYFEKKTDK